MNQINIEEKYKEIKKDIIDNISEVFERTHYYSHKYRGDEWNDINVSINTEDVTENYVQIYLRNKSGYIKDKTVLKNNNISTDVDTSFYNLDFLDYGTR